MTLLRIFCFSFLTLAACSSNEEVDIRVDVVRKSEIIKGYLNRKNITKNGCYYMLQQVSDSTIKIIWGNDTLKRIYDEPLAFMFVERLSVKWENKNYVILNYGTGTSAWSNVVLPIDTKQQVQIFTNGIYFDLKSNLLVTEEVGDTILAVRNLKTLQSQFVIEKGQRCASANNSDCIDTVSINDKTLYYKWVTPRNFSDRDSSSNKRMRLRI